MTAWPYNQMGLGAVRTCLLGKAGTTMYPALSTLPNLMDRDARKTAYVIGLGLRRERITSYFFRIAWETAPSRRCRPFVRRA